MFRLQLQLSPGSRVDTAYAITPEARRMIEDAVMAEYRKVVAEAGSNGREKSLIVIRLATVTAPLVSLLILDSPDLLIWAQARPSHRSIRRSRAPRHLAVGYNSYCHHNTG